LGIEFNFAETVAVKSNIVDVPQLPNAIVFSNTTTVAQCINNRTSSGQVIQAFASLLSTQISGNGNLWADLGKAMAYRIVSRVSSPPVELTLPVIDSPAAGDPSKAPPGYRFTVQNAAVINRVRLKNPSGVVIAELPPGVWLTLTP